MLSFFRSNQFFVAIPLALYIVGVHAGALLGYVQPPAGGVDGGLMYQSWFGWADSTPVVSAWAAALIVFIQSITINFLADEFRLTGERNWFPGLFYAMAASALPDFLFLSAPLVAASFIPLSLRSIYKAYQKPQVTGAIFDAGLWVAVASLFYPPALLLAIPTFIGVEVVRVFRIHERFVLLTGLFVPLFLAWLWYFWADKGGVFRDVQWGHLIQLGGIGALWSENQTVKIALIAFLTLVFLFGLGVSDSRKGIQSQKFTSVLYWFLAIGALSALLSNPWQWAHLLLPATTVGILFAMLFQNIRNRPLADFLHLGMLCFIFFVQFAHYFLSLSFSLF